MTDVPNGRERELFEAAVALPPEERDSFVSEACAEDRDLASRIRRLIAAHVHATEDGSRSAGIPDSIDDQDTQVGPYRLVERIGEGGMGVVYIAEQRTPVRRRVALKLIKAGMDTKEVIGRFHSERQALALMTHPNIARILDGGTTADGRPFFVMEYVPGMPLLEYCDRRRVTVRGRVQLFVDICMAVQHAHQKGVIHRDIKPTNVLVTEEDNKPAPKIIDFGVAKAVHRRLGDFTVHTGIGGFVGTPDYVSPEQIQATALDVDTRADVYSLGAVLYELLCGERPFDLRDKGYAEIQQAISERDPPPPSLRAGRGDDAEARAECRGTDPEALVRKLRGDLDWITMMAMEKDRKRRYSSASELAADLKRHLTRHPVIAGPPSRTYRLGRLVRRHAVLLVVGAIGLFALIAAVAGTTFGLLRARQEAQRTRLQAAITEEINTFLNEDLLASVAPRRQGLEVTVREVLDRAAEQIEGKFRGQPLVEAALRRTIGTTYSRLGEYDAAEPHLDRALELRRESQGPTHAETLLAAVDLGRLLWRQGRHAESEPLIRQALERQRKTLGDDHGDTLDSIVALGTLVAATGRYDEAERLYLEALEAHRRGGGSDPGSTLRVAEDLSILYQSTGRLAEAEALQLEAWQGIREALGEEHPTTLNSAINLSALHLRQGRFSEAEPLMTQTLAALRRVMGPEHPRTLMMMNNLGWLYENSQRFDEAEVLLLETAEIKRRVLGEDHPSSLESIQNLMSLYNTTNESAKLEAQAIELLRQRKKRAERPGAAPKEKNDYARLLLDARPERLRNPRIALRFALEAVGAGNPPELGFLKTLADAYHATGDSDRAIETAARAIDLITPGRESARQTLEADIERYGKFASRP